MEKTEKSMTELQIEANENLQLDKITEAGRDLTPLHGPGYVGLHNLVRGRVRVRARVRVRVGGRVSTPAPAQDQP